MGQYPRGNEALKVRIGNGIVAFPIDIYLFSFMTKNGRREIRGVSFPYSKF